MELITHVDVDASPEEVWAVLIDFDRYYEWNPFMRIAGRPTENARLHVRLFPPGARPTQFRPTVTRIDPARALAWHGHLWMPGMFDGDHRFVLDSLDDGRTRVTHAEVFSGALVPIIWRFVGDAIERGFETMNAALKRRVETGAVGSDEHEWRDTIDTAKSADTPAE